MVGAPVDPRVPARPKRVWVKDINRFPFPDDSPLPYSEAIFDRMAVEVARGCTEGCRFCQAGMIYRPVRERDPVAVIDALVEGVRKGGYDETSLTSLSTADYSCVTPLVKAAMAKLRDEKVSLSVSSLRAYGLNDDLLADMATMKAQGLTFAPEAGTQRMRDVITKNVTEEDITVSAERVFGRGLPAHEAVLHDRPAHRGGRRRAGHRRDRRPGQADRAQLLQERRGDRLGLHPRAQAAHPVPVGGDGQRGRDHAQAGPAGRGRPGRCGSSLKMHENYQSHLEGIFSRGDRACADLLERAYRLGCRFDGWDEGLRPELWDQALAEEQRGHGLRAASATWAPSR